MTIAIGNDHAGVDYKNAITAFLKSKNIEVLNFGTDTPESVDYPDFGHAVAQALEEGKSDVGWGSQIRSYVLDSSRIKDLRTSHETGNTKAVLDGDLDDFIEASLKQGV